MGKTRHSELCTPPLHKGIHSIRSTEFATLSNWVRNEKYGFGQKRLQPPAPEGENLHPPIDLPGCMLGSCYLLAKTSVYNI